MAALMTGLSEAPLGEVLAHLTAVDASNLARAARYAGYGPRPPLAPTAGLHGLADAPETPCLARRLAKYAARASRHAVRRFFSKRLVAPPLAGRRAC